MCGTKKKSRNRLESIKQLYVEDCVLVEFGEGRKGYAKINKQVNHVIYQLPPNFIFTIQKMLILILIWED